MTFVPPEPDPVDDFIQRAIMRTIAQRAVARRTPPPAPPAPERRMTPFPTKPPCWSGDVPRSTVSERSVHVELWAAGDHWRCAEHGEGQGRGCIHVGFAREGSFERSEKTGQLHQELSMAHFTCRAAITLTSLRHEPKPRRRPR